MTSKVAKRHKYLCYVSWPHREDFPPKPHSISAVFQAIRSAQHNTNVKLERKITTSARVKAKKVFALIKAPSCGCLQPAPGLSLQKSSAQMPASLYLAAADKKTDARSFCLVETKALLLETRGWGANGRYGFFVLTWTTFALVLCHFVCDLTKLTSLAETQWPRAARSHTQRISAVRAMTSRCNFVWPRRLAICVSPSHLRVSYHRFACFENFLKIFPSFYGVKKWVCEEKTM